MAYYRKNKRRFDPRYFLSERMEEEEPDFSFTGDVGELGGDEAFGVGWNAALGEISSMVRELMSKMGAEEDEDADPVGDMAGEALPQMIGEPPMEE